MSEQLPQIQTAAQPQSEPKPATGRDEQGRFAAGNKGGPGNPFAGRVADLRQAFLDAVTKEDMQAIARAMVKKATEGSVPAAKIVLAHVLGKPAASLAPDGAQQPQPQLLQIDLTPKDWEEIRKLAREGSYQDPLLPLKPPSANGNLRGQGRGQGSEGFPLPADLGNPANVSLVAGRPSPDGK